MLTSLFFSKPAEKGYKTHKGTRRILLSVDTNERQIQMRYVFRHGKSYLCQKIKHVWRTRTVKKLQSFRYCPKGRRAEYRHRPDH